MDIWIEKRATCAVLSRPRRASVRSLFTTVSHSFASILLPFIAHADPPFLSSGLRIILVGNVIVCLARSSLFLSHCLASCPFIGWRERERERENS